MALLPLLLALARQPRGIERPRPYRLFAIGLTAGITYFTGTLYWLADVMVTFGGLARPLAIGAAALLIAYLALFPALFVVIVGYARRRLGPEALLIAPGVWVAAELGRSYALTGFPWVLLGNSQVSVLPIAQAASVFGVYGLSALVGAPAACIAYAWAAHDGLYDGIAGSRSTWTAGSPGGAASVGRAARVGPARRAAWMRWAPLAVVLAVTIGVGVWGALRMRAGDLTREGQALRVGIVQGNIAQRNKWSPNWANRIIATYLELSYRIAEERVSLIVWPEASLPFFFELDPGRAASVRTLAQQTGAFLLVGGDQVERAGATAATPPEGPGATPAPPDADDRFYNSAFLIRPDGSVAGTYKKMQLVPFGEYVPFKSLLYFAGPIVEAVGDFYAGERVEVLRMDDAGTTGAAGSTPGAASPASPASDGRPAPVVGGLSTAICYEAIFPWLAREAVRAGSQLLTTITNDAWYGTSSAPFQHFEQARLRAIEQGRYLVRSANTGISGVVDPYGRVVVKTELFVPAAMASDVRLLDQWTLYARIGDTFAYACVVLTVLVAAVAWRSR